MSSSIARRREAKAARRKKLLAERRKQGGAETGTSMASRVDRMAQMPIHRCVLQEGLFEQGNGTLLLVRGTPATGLMMAGFLLDTFCLGVKDAYVRPMEDSELDEYFELMKAAGAEPFFEAEPAYARKLLRDLVAYARAIGIEPPREYGTAERLFGSVSAETCETTFEFGSDGRPLYVQGPNETPAQVRQRLEALRRAVGEDGFDFVDESDLLDEEGDLLDEEGDILGEEDEDEEFLEGYDPAEAPDPKEWLERDEGERIVLAEHYHRREGLHCGSDKLHAVMHVVVENQIADNDPPVVAPTLRRLMAEGLDRHNAIHAIGAVLGGFMFEVLRAEGSREFSTEEYSAALERLTPESWRRDYAEEESADEA